MGRAYLSFYKTGLKNVYHNYRASLPIRRSLGLPAYLPTSPPPAPPSSNSQSNKGTAFRKAIESVKLSRSSFQLVRRAAYDVRRMIPFTLILIVCGEMTPLAVLALGNAVTPFTCRVPRQLEKDRAQRVARKRAALVAQQAATSGSVTPPAAGSDLELDILVKMYTNLEWIESASAEEILRACAVLNLVKTHTRPSVLLSLYRARLQRYAEYLSLDDQLIRRCGGVRAMEGAEVRTAVEERGGVGVTEGKEGWDAERDERRWLEKWLERR
ncbi:LETM1-like protein [Aspergillus parasiticus SU-1]|nr:LETM1-like protein [Aspergillus parasiticus SU-1]